ncbi:hypothetical protein CQA40_02080 [Helicobacter sp. MIT 01-3238]|nr:hypothetical protein CQA40_02080 [Helicobacter sp. MIT 01-3238]
MFLFYLFICLLGLCVFILLDFDSALLFFGCFCYFLATSTRNPATKFSYPKSYKFMLKLPFCLRVMAIKLCYQNHRKLKTQNLNFHFLRRVL